MSEIAALNDPNKGDIIIRDWHPHPSSGKVVRIIQRVVKGEDVEMYEYKESGVLKELETGNFVPGTAKHTIGVDSDPVEMGEIARQKRKDAIVQGAIKQAQKMGYKHVRTPLDLAELTGERIYGLGIEGGKQGPSYLKLFLGQADWLPRKREEQLGPRQGEFRLSLEGDLEQFKQLVRGRPKIDPDS